ncbi:MAG: hypothetical protein AAGM67_05190, partial [Bacteroidota bacterium]
ELFWIGLIAFCEGFLLAGLKGFFSLSVEKNDRLGNIMQQNLTSKSKFEEQSKKRVTSLLPYY